MPGVEQFTPQEVDAAWQSAHSANQLHTELREAGALLAAAQLLAAANVADIQIGPNAMPLLAQNVSALSAAFEAAQDAATEVMLHPHSPFNLHEHGESRRHSAIEAINREPRFLREDDLHKLALETGRTDQTAKHVYDMFAVSAVLVSSADLPRIMQDAADGTALSNYMLQIVDENGMFIDKALVNATLLLDFKRLLTEDFLRYAEPASIAGMQLLAEYFIRTGWLDGSEMSLLANYTPPQAYSAAESGTEPELTVETEPDLRLLLDTVEINGETIWIVTSQSLIQWIACQAKAELKKIPSYAPALERLRIAFAPTWSPVGIQPQMFSDMLVYTGQRRSSGTRGLHGTSPVWGIPVSEFRWMLERASSGGLLRLTSAMQENLDAYCKELERVEGQFARSRLRPLEGGQSY